MRIPTWPIHLLLGLLALLPACGGSGRPQPEDPGPTIEVTALTPFTGSTAGGYTATFEGSGFIEAGVAIGGVRFGGTDATDVRVVDDETITCTVPLGLDGVVTVTLFAAGSEDVLASGWFVYVGTFIYAIDGPDEVVWMLRRIDIQTGIPRNMGLAAHPFYAMTTADDGTLYATEASAHPRLFVIDPVTAESRAIGLLKEDQTDTWHQILDIAFVGPRLYGWSATAGLVEITLQLGYVVPVATDPMPTVPGGGLVADANGLLHLAPAGNPAPLVRIDPTTGAVTTGPVFQEPGGLLLGGLTMHEGELLGVGRDPGTGAAVDLLGIDPDTGAVRVLAPLPSGTSGIALAP